MPLCPWCERICSQSQMVEVELPDDDSIEVCEKCSLEDEMKKEEKHSTPRLKTKDRDYAGAGYRR